MQRTLSAGEISRSGPLRELETYLQDVIICPLRLLRQKLRRLPKHIFILWNMFKALVTVRSRTEVRNH